jgi:hypoxanthine phosphoribosyltransferase
MMEKLFVDPQQLLEDSVKLGLQIMESGFKPTFTVGIWRGGTPVGIAVQELLDYFGINTDHIAIRTSYYTGIGQRGKSIRVHGLDYIVENINAEDDLLIVDDVFDSGQSVKAVIDTLKNKCRKNTPLDIRIAVVYFKPANNQTDTVPDYYIHETDKWLIFPHELTGLTPQEAEQHKPKLFKLIKGFKRS